MNPLLTLRLWSGRLTEEEVKEVEAVIVLFSDSEVPEGKIPVHKRLKVSYTASRIAFTLNLSQK